MPEKSISGESLCNTINTKKPWTTFTVKLAADGFEGFTLYSFLFCSGLAVPHALYCMQRLVIDQERTSYSLPCKEPFTNLGPCEYQLLVENVKRITKVSYILHIRDLEATLSSTFHYELTH